MKEWMDIGEMQSALEESKIMMMLIGGCGQVLRRRRILKEGVI